MPHQSTSTLCFGNSTTPRSVFKNGRFSPLDRQHLTNTICHLLLKTKYSHHQYSSHSFRSGTATTAAAEGISDWLIKILGRWSSNAYQVYIYTLLSGNDTVHTCTLSSRQQHLQYRQGSQCTVIPTNTVC